MQKQKQMWKSALDIWLFPGKQEEHVFAMSKNCMLILSFCRLKQFWKHFSAQLCQSKKKKKNRRDSASCTPDFSTNSEFRFDFTKKEGDRSHDYIPL